MTALRLLTGGTPPLFPTVKASNDLERAWRNLCDAHDRFLDCELGSTDELFRRRDAWVEAATEYEAARVKLAEAVARKHGRTRLRLVVNDG